MYYDFHVHSDFSSDSHAPMEAMIQEGIRLGLPGICFTEHMDLDFPGDKPVFLVDLPAYKKTFLSLKEKYKHQIQLFYGLELGLQPHLAKELPLLAASDSFDFLIGSAHIIDRLDPYCPEYFQGRSEQESYLRYFQMLLENLKTFSCFDTCGHIDYVVRYGPAKNKNYSYQAYREILDEILKVLIEKGIGLECNTAGFKYGLGHPNPTEDILLRYHELGGEILTLGSDGHAPKHLAYDFEKAGNLLKACGFRYYTIFKNRKPEFHKL